MAINLASLYNNSKTKYNLEIIAGSRGMANIVRWVHIIEDQEVPNFLHGNELIFTTGIATKDSLNMIQFIKNLMSHKSAGWIINLGPYIKEVSKEVIDYCNTVDFPLFTIPWQMRLIDVTYDYSHMIIENEKRELSLISAFRNIILHQGNQTYNLEILDRMGYSKNGNYRIAFITCFSDKKIVKGELLKKALFNLQAAIADLINVLLIDEDSSLVVLLNSTTDINKVIERIDERLKFEYDNPFITIGISDEFQGLSLISDCYNQAKIACNTALIKDLKTLYYKDCGVYKYIYAQENSQINSDYLNESLGDVIRYDEINHTNYLTLLRLYIEYNGSIQDLADHFKCHRNTINYKIKFINTNFKITTSLTDLANVKLALCILDTINNFRRN